MVAAPVALENDLICRTRSTSPSLTLQSHNCLPLEMRIRTIVSQCVREHGTSLDTAAHGPPLLQLLSMLMMRDWKLLVSCTRNPRLVASILESGHTYISGSVVHWRACLCMWSIYGASELPVTVCVMLEERMIAVPGLRVHVRLSCWSPD